VVLLHGWEGSADSLYLLSLAQLLFEQRFEVVRLNLRDHGDTHHLNRELFHSCRLPEVVGAVRALQQRFAPRPLQLVGFSLGGNFMLRVAAQAREAGLDLERVIAACRKHDLLLIYDNPYCEITFDGYRAPSFLATPGAKDVGIEVFSLSKGYNMTGWRCAVVVGNAEAVQTYWRLKSNIDSGLFEAVQLAGIAALSPDADAEVAALRELYVRRRDLVCDALRAIGIHVQPPHATIYVWAPVPDGFASSEAYCEHVLEQVAVVISPGSMYGPSGEGWFRISLTTPDDRLLEAVQRLGSLAV